jgi:YD repeat-containing protein
MAGPRGTRRAWSTTALTTLAVSIVASVASGAGSVATGPREAPDYAGDPAFAEAIADARAQGRLKAERRATPEARADRARSRRAFADAGTERAIEIAGDKFPAALASDVWHEPGLEPGDRVESYSGLYSATLERPNGRGSAIVESNVPLRARNERGDLQPVELALEDRGDTLVPQNPIVPVQFPKRGRRGASFSNSGIAFYFAGATDSEGSDGRAVRDRIFHANSDRDTDFFVTPTPAGAEAFFVLRSEDSPERLALTFDLPAGAELRMRSDGSGGAEVIGRNGSALVSIPPPAAVDADGTPIAVSASVTGHQFQMRLEHRPADLHYPLLVDPVITEVHSGDGFNGTGWQPTVRQTNTGWFSGWLGPWNGSAQTGPVGLNIWSAPGLHYNHGDYASWYLNPYRQNVIIPAASWVTSHWPWATMAQYGIWKVDDAFGNGHWVQDSGTDNPQLYSNPFAQVRQSVCVQRDPFCRWDKGEVDAHASMSLITWGTSTWRSQSASLQMSQTYIYYGDKTTPSVGAVTGLGTPDTNPATRAWAETDSATVGGTASDSGLGLAKVGLTAPGRSWAGPAPHTPSCAGTSTSQCPVDQPVSLTASTTDAGLSGIEGEIPIDVFAQDKLFDTTTYSDHQATKNVGRFRIDRSRPSAYSADNGKWLKEGDHRLQATVTDTHSGLRQSTLWTAPASDRFERTSSNGWGQADQAGESPPAPSAHWRFGETQVIDDFNSLAGWSFDSGAGTLNVSGGELVPTNTSEKLLHRPGAYIDARSTLKFKTGSTFPPGGIALLLRRRDADNWLSGGVSPSGVLFFGKEDAGTQATISSSAAFGALAASTTYWVRFSAVGNALTANLYTADPANGASPVRSHSYTLTGADAAKFGAGVSGNAGIGTTSVPTDYRYDSYRLDPLTADDADGSNDGTYDGGVSLGQAGVLSGDPNPAVRLDGASGRITTAYDPFARGSARTFEGWAKRTTNSTSDALFAGTGSPGYPVLRAKAGGNDVRFNPDTSGAGQDFANALPGTGVWFHWALVWHGPSRQATLYVNGVSKGTLTFGYDFAGAPGTLEFGAEGGTNNPFDGYLDEFAVYNGVLSAAAIAQRSRGGRTWIVDEGPASDFSTTPADGGRIDVPSGGGFRSASLYGRQIKNVDVSAKVKFGQRTTGTGATSFAALLLRRQPDGGDNYRVGLVATDQDRLEVRGARTVGGESQPAFIGENTNLGFNPNTWYRLRVAALTDESNPSSPTTTIYVKYWTGDEEPIAWNIVTAPQPGGPHGAGGVGVRAAGGSTSAQQFHFDDIKVLDRDARQVRDGRNPEPDGPICSASSGCPTSLTHDYVLNTAGFGEGPIEVVGTASDPVSSVTGNTANLHGRWDSWQRNLDRTNPTLKVTWDPPITSGQRLWEDEYKATISATDPRSGIKKAELLVDGQRLRGDHLFERNAACDGCGLTHTFTLRTEDLAPGDHTISISSRDFAGNDSATQSWPVVVTAAGGGDLPQFRFDTYAGNEDLDLKVNLGSGNLLVTSKDVNDPEMPVSRFYNSESSGRRGSFGKGWTTALGGDVRLREAADGSVLYFGPSQYVVRFARKADGTYSPPPLFVGSLTRRADGVHVVTDAAIGETLEFPSASSRLQARGIDGTGNVKVAYKPDGSIDTLTDPDDWMTSFETSSGRIMSVSHPEEEDEDGVVVKQSSYSYDASGLLQDSTRPGLGTTAYDYDADERLHEITLPDGTRFVVTYNGDSQAATVASVTKYAPGAAVGEITTYSFSGDQTTVVRPTGAAVYRRDTNFQVYTQDAEAPEVFEPFGYDADPSEPSNIGGYANGVDAIDLDVTVDDSASGVKRVWLEQSGRGVVAERTTACEQLPGDVGFVSVCPPRYHTTIPISTSGLPEGASSFTLRATDGAGNTGSAPSFDVLVDRTAPPAPTQIQMDELDESLHTADFNWELPGDDPDLPTGQPGSGITTTSYRFKRAGNSVWSQWTDAEEDFGTIANALRGEVYNVEVRVSDAVGNASTASGALTVGDPPNDPPEETGMLPAGSSTLEFSMDIDVPVEGGGEYRVDAAGTRVELIKSSGERALRLADDDGKVVFANIAAGTYELVPVDDSQHARSVTLRDGETRHETHSAAQPPPKLPIPTSRAALKWCFPVNSVRRQTRKIFCAYFAADALAANRETEQNFGVSYQASDGTKANAFRHSLWLAKMVRSIFKSAALDDDSVGAAYTFGRLHEADQKAKRSFVQQKHVKMDLHNDRVGYQYSKRKAKKHNFRFLCNRMRTKVRHGKFAKFRKVRGYHAQYFARRYQPAKGQVIWVHRYLPGSIDEPGEHGVVPHLTVPTRC